MQTTDTQQTTEATDRCPVCGRIIQTATMKWSARLNQPVWTKYLLKGESCDYSDD
jgi:hypothetical protein